jgi:hypothetical protein
VVLTTEIRVDENSTQSKTKNFDSPNSGDCNVLKIIVDEPAEEDALDFQHYSKNLANIIRGTTPQFAVGIFGKWGTGKTTLMRMIEQEIDNERDKEKILTVWFDAWRYEKEKYLAVIPFLRQVRIKLENDVAKNRKTSRWNVLKEGLGKTFTAFIESTEISVAPPESPVSSTTSLEKFVSSLRSKGSTHIDGEHIQFHEHVTDYLKNALIKLEQENPGSRIVVFVDDLDRCTPQNALEVIESIKAFFDIKGIVYVLGMDSDSIDYIIEQKYGKDSGIKGIDYLQKIVQLPFQIPLWKNKDIEGSIEDIIKKGLKGSEQLAGEFLDPARKKLIVNSVKPNLRQVKRFINNIILAKQVFGKDVDIDKLIAVQALNFNRDWNRFLELISPDPPDLTRRTFFRDYYINMRNHGKVIDTKDALDNFIKEKFGASITPPKEITDIFLELVNQKDYTLSNFLKAGADEILGNIERMEDYRRALEATKPQAIISQTDRVTQKDISLRYSCWRYEKADKKHNNRRMYAFHVIVNASSSILDRIEYVTYRLPAWPFGHAVQKVTNRDSHFGLKELAWGSSTLFADVKIKGEDDVISLSHPIILTEKGERLL